MRRPARNRILAAWFAASRSHQCPPEQRDARPAVRLACSGAQRSNVHARETFRHHSYFSDIAVGTISGLGAVGYELALRAASQLLAGKSGGPPLPN